MLADGTGVYSFSRMFSAMWRFAFAERRNEARAAVARTSINGPNDGPTLRG